MTNLAGVLPASAKMVIMIPDLSEMRDSVDITLERVSAFQPQIRMFEQQIAREMGIRITDEESWKNSGITPDGSLMVAVVGNRPVVATFVDDREAFESRFIERMRQFTRTDSPVRNETIGGRSFKVSGDQAGSDIAWFYDGNMVVLAMPPFDAFGVFEEGTATNILSNVAAAAGDGSLANDESFQTYRKGMGDRYPVSVYFSGEYLRDVGEGQAQAAGNEIAQFLAAFDAGDGGAGVGVRANETRLELRSLFVGDEDLIAAAEAAFISDHDVDFSGFLTKNTLLAVRSSFDLEKAYDFYMEQLPDEDRRALRRSLSRTGQAYQIDIEEDVIKAFSGHGVLAFYGVAGDMTRMAAMLGGGGSVGDTIRTVLANAGLVLSTHFADQEKFDNLMAKVTEIGGDDLNQRALVYEGSEVDDVEVLEPRMLNLFPARMFVRGDTLTVAAAGIGENAAYQYLTGDRPEGLLSDSDDFPLGKMFAEADAYNGLYLNFERLRWQIRRVPMVSGFANQLNMFHELLATTGVDEHGIYGSLIVDFTEPLQRDEQGAE